MLKTSGDKGPRIRVTVSSPEGLDARLESETDIKRREAMDSLKRNGGFPSITEWINLVKARLRECGINYSSGSVDSLVLSPLRRSLVESGVTIENETPTRSDFASSVGLRVSQLNYVSRWLRQAGVTEESTLELLVRKDGLRFFSIIGDLASCGNGIVPAVATATGEVFGLVMERQFCEWYQAEMIRGRNKRLGNDRLKKVPDEVLSRVIALTWLCSSSYNAVTSYPLNLYFALKGEKFLGHKRTYYRSSDTHLSPAITGIVEGVMKAFPRDSGSVRDYKEKVYSAVDAALQCISDRVGPILEEGIRLAIKNHKGLVKSKEFRERRLAECVLRSFDVMKMRYVNDGVTITMADVGMSRSIASERVRVRENMALAVLSACEPVRALLERDLLGEAVKITATAYA